jgi:hypothetical protein
MKRTLCLICIGTLALTLTAWGQPTKQARPERANAHRTANVRATRPANNAAMRSAHHYTATAPSRQRTYMASRTHPKVVNHDAARLSKTSRDRDLRARNNAAVNASETSQLIGQGTSRSTVIVMRLSCVHAKTSDQSRETLQLIGQGASRSMRSQCCAAFRAATT